MDQDILYQAVTAAQDDLSSALSDCCSAAIVSLEKGTSGSHTAFQHVLWCWFYLLPILGALFLRM